MPSFGRKLLTSYRSGLHRKIVTGLRLSVGFEVALGLGFLEVAGLVRPFAGQALHLRRDMELGTVALFCAILTCFAVAFLAALWDTDNPQRRYGAVRR